MKRVVVSDKWKEFKWTLVIPYDLNGTAKNVDKIRWNSMKSNEIKGRKLTPNVTKRYQVEPNENKWNEIETERNETERTHATLSEINCGGMASSHI